MNCHVCGKACTNFFKVEIHLYTPKNMWVTKKIGWCNKHKESVMKACYNMGFIKA